MKNDKDDKQTYRDFVDIIRFARGPSDLHERQLILSIVRTNRMSRANHIKARYTLDSFIFENRAKKIMIDFIKRFLCLFLETFISNY